MSVKAPKKFKNYSLQTVLIPRNKFSLANAIIWLSTHGYQYKKVDTTRGFMRFRQEPPNGKKYFTKTLSNDIMLVFQQD